MTFQETISLLHYLISTHQDLLVTGKYSQDTEGVCPRCSPTPTFQLANPNVILSLSGYCQSFVLSVLALEGKKVSGRISQAHPLLGAKNRRLNRHNGSVHLLGPATKNSLLSITSANPCKPPN
jgi:hypothetical protein